LVFFNEKNFGFRGNSSICPSHGLFKHGFRRNDVVQRWSSQRRRFPVRGSRLTNHFATTTTANGMMVNSDFYFDQATGMMVQWRQETVQTSGSVQTTTTQMMKVTSSNVWAIPEFSTFFVASAFIVGLPVSMLVVLGIIKFKRIRALKNGIRDF